MNDLREKLEKLKTDTLLLLVDRKVYSLYGRFLKLKTKKVYIYKLDAKEKKKSFKEVEKCLHFFLSKNIHKNAFVIGIGGGLTLDLASFVASLIYRGLPLILVPTTLLSQVDAAYGGKTGINFLNAKNQIGTYYFPEKIFVYHEFLKTLGKRELDSGKAEIIKYALLSSKIYKKICRYSGQERAFERIILACADFKMELISADPFEKDLRKALNLGHTLGHLLELEYKVSHGHAVFLGMKYLFTFLDRRDLLNELETLSKKLDVEFSDLMLNKKVLSHILKDKKRRTQNSIDFITLKKLFCPMILRIEF